MAAAAVCLEESTLWAFVHGELAPADAAEARAHVDACAECRMLVGAVAKGLPEVAEPAGPLPPDLDATIAHVLPELSRTPNAVAGAEAGTIVDGKYRIEHQLGSGGMGYVVAARHVQLGTRVALKILHAHVASGAEAHARFLREARAATRIDSPHAVRVFDVGLLESGSPFLVMELLEGHDLSSEIAQRQRLPAGEAVRLLLQACHALSQAHKSGIVHRDLKPANMFLVGGEDGSPRTLKLLDFGTSKLLTRRTIDIEDPTTTGGGWIGTPRYMAPEQIKLGHAVTERTDIWGLGMVLYELIAGTPPFNAGDLQDHCRAVLEDVPIALDVARPGTSRALSVIVARCLAKDAAQRWPSVAELAAALEPFAEGDVTALVEQIVRGDDGAISVRSTARSTPPFSPKLAPKKRSVRAMIALSAVGLAIGIGLVLVVLPKSASTVSAEANVITAAPVSAPPVSAAFAPPTQPEAPAPSVAAASPAPPATTPRRATRPPPPPARHSDFGSRR